MSHLIKFSTKAEYEQNKENLVLPYTVYCEDTKELIYNTDGNINKSTIISVGFAEENGGEIFNDYAENNASGKFSHAEGKSTISDNFSQHACGQFNTAETIPSPELYNADKSIFKIGNGTSSANRSDAMKVNGDGTTWIKDINGFTGTNSSTSNSLQAIFTNIISRIETLENGDTPGPDPQPVKKCKITFSKPAHGRFEINNKGTFLKSGDTVDSGSVVTLSVYPDGGWKFSHYTANGTRVFGDAYTVNEDVDFQAILVDDQTPIPTGDIGAISQNNEIIIDDSTLDKSHTYTLKYIDYGGNPIQSFGPIEKNIKLQ